VLQPVVIIPSNSAEPRLTPEEIEEIARFAYTAHDHSGSTPAQPSFWLRSDCDLSHFWN
jgi:hypothetical protein